MILLFLRFLFILGTTFKVFFCPMYGPEEYFDIQSVEEVQGSQRCQIRKRRNSHSKIFKCIVSCLIAGRHKHMLEFCEKSENGIRFKVTLKNKKSREWHKAFISFFMELDGVFKDRSRCSNKYEEDTKGRFRSNINKLIKSGKIKRIRWWKEKKSTTEHIFEILCPDALAEVRKSNISAEMNHVTGNANITHMDIYNFLVENATAHARLDIDGDPNLKNFGENQIPPKSEEKNQLDYMDVLQLSQEICSKNQFFLESPVNEVKNASVSNEVVEKTSNSLNVKNGKILNDTGSIVTLENVAPFAGNASFMDASVYQCEDISEQRQSLINENNTGSIVTSGNAAPFAGNASFMDVSVCQYEDISEQRQSLINENGNGCVDVMKDNASIADLSYQSLLQYPDLLEQSKNNTSFSGNFDCSFNLEDNECIDLDDDLSVNLDNNLSLPFFSSLADYEKMDMENGSEDWQEKFGRIPSSNE